MPYTASTGKRSNSPSASILRAPPRPSSAGWKMSCTVPAKSRLAERCFAAPSSMVVCPSCPQACITPWLVEACDAPVCSWIASASMSARSPIAR